MIPFNPEGATAADLRSIRIHIELHGPKPVGEGPIVRLMGDTPPILVEVKHEDGTSTFEPEKPTAYTLLRKVKYANPRAKARVALKHLKGHPDRTRGPR